MSCTNFEKNPTELADDVTAHNQIPENRLVNPEIFQLRGRLDGFWAVNVSGNWRLVFRFVGTDVELVDYLDYH
ncbi:type II toxin-antitoxin system RelE/ParE family toxin [Pseudomonas faucium]|uniref:type II toxin-antitoxin system RelE/ParE family toxin n=1 Tax=Pseudomonas faucium TaxID=2740518 RepID=UPI0039C2F97A